jgi:hypothetical protein
MKIILFIIANTIASLSGANLISMNWLIATFVIDYVRAILSESDNAADGNFRNLSNNDFLKSEANIKIATLKNLIVSAIFFGLGMAANFLGWV